MDIAVRDGTVEEWLASLDAATAALSDPTVTRVLANPALPYAGRRQAAAQLLGTAIDDKPRNLVLLLIRRGRIEQLPDAPDKLDFGRYSQGIEQMPNAPDKLRIGRYSQGIEQMPAAPSKLRRGSFAASKGSRRELA